MELLKLDQVIASVVYSLLGVVMFWLSFIVIDRLTPYDLWKNLVEERNQALATVVAAMCLGVAIIVASAIH